MRQPGSAGLKGRLTRLGAVRGSSPADVHPTQRRYEGKAIDCPVQTRFRLCTARGRVFFIMVRLRFRSRDELFEMRINICNPHLATLARR